MNTVKAYKNNSFLMSGEAREIRILSEYLEPRARLMKAGVQRGIAFFGSARLCPGGDPDYCSLAADMGRRLARWTLERHRPGQRYHFCTGGGPGLMEAVGRGVADVDRRLNIGFNISLPHEQHANPYLDPGLTFEFHYFFMRKFWFANLAQGVVAFPGGFGTLDELYEILTLMQTGKIGRRPVVLFGSEFWERTTNFDELVARKLIDSGDTAYFREFDEVEPACDFLIEHLDRAHDNAPEALAPQPGGV